MEMSFSSNYFEGKKIMTTTAYIICKDEIDNKVQALKRLIGDANIPVNVVQIEVPKDISYPKSLDQNDMAEIYRFIWCLNEARKSHPTHHLIILKGDSTSNVNSDELKEIISQIESSKYDLAYLSKWGDACEKYDLEQASKIGKSLLLKSHSPNGTQALVVSPQCRDKLLGLVSLDNNQKIQDYTTGLSDFFNDLIVSSNLEALAIIPNAFNSNFDDLKSGRKLNECSNDKGKGTLYMIIGSILVILIISVIIICMKK
jgi:hypothetical protein